MHRDTGEVVKTPIIMSWSGGKDSSLALAILLSDGSYEILSLLTTVTDEYDRISMHGVRFNLLEEQSTRLGIPLTVVRIPPVCVNEIYEQRMSEALAGFKEKGVSQVAFGDIFLEDLRAYREEKLAQTNFSALFPIWKKNTKDLSRYFVDAGFKAVVTCVDTQQLDGSFSGRVIDHGFLSDLPDGVDPCGENGEFHSFVFDAPIFTSSIPLSIGEKVLRDDRFMYCDVDVKL